MCLRLTILACTVIVLKSRLKDCICFVSEHFRLGIQTACGIHMLSCPAASAALHNRTALMMAALQFFLGQDELEPDESDDDEVDETKVAAPTKADIFKATKKVLMPASLLHLTDTFLATFPLPAGPPIMATVFSKAVDGHNWTNDEILKAFE